MKKTLLIVFAAALLLALLTACGPKEVAPVYTDNASIEAALNAGENLVGKVVTFTVDVYTPNSDRTYDLQAGEHVHFVCTGSPNVFKGDSMTVTITEVTKENDDFIVKFKKK